VQTLAATPATYLTDISIKRFKDKNQYEAVVRVKRLLERHNAVTEEDIGQPIRVTGSFGTKISGGRAEGRHGVEGVVVDMFWPTQDEPEFAVCTVTVTRSGKVEAKSRLKLKAEAKQ